MSDDFLLHMWENQRQPADKRLHFGALLGKLEKVGQELLGEEKLSSSEKLFISNVLFAIHREQEMPQERFVNSEVKRQEPSKP